MAIKRGFWTEVGLAGRGAFYREGYFLAALVAPLALWGVAWRLAPEVFPRLSLDDPALLVSLIVWQPFLEELLFRGVVQGQMARHRWGQAACWGVSAANLATSVLFVLAHLVYHSAAWAVAVLVPSLVFGYFRDRHASVWPGWVLHAYYNAGYFLLGAFLSK